MRPTKTNVIEWHDENGRAMLQQRGRCEWFVPVGTVNREQLLSLACAAVEALDLDEEECHALNVIMGYESNVGTQAQ